jgi:hypothetical protein
MARTATSARGKATVADRKPASARGAKLTVVRKSKNWWGEARQPQEASTVTLATTTPERGGDYLVLRLGERDGEKIVSRGIARLSLESIKKRTVVLSTIGAGDEGRRWGTHKIRMTPTMPPHVHLPVEDGKFRTVESRAEENEIEMKFDGDDIVFELPPSIR